jgi:TolB protein
VRRAQTVGLTVAVVIVTSGVTFTLGRMFGTERPEEAAESPTPFARSVLAVAFASDRDGNLDIYVASADGSNPRRITDDPEDDLGPAWSPDGTRIAFTRGLEDDPNIFVMNADGSGLVQLTDDPADDTDPAWSPDGTSIAFVSTRARSTDLFLMDADGSRQRQLTAGTASEFDPAWSADGTELFFSRDESDGVESSDIWVMEVRSGDVRKVIGQASQPAPSPEGSRLAFVSNRDGNAEIYVMDLPEGEPVRLTDSTEDKSRPSWSPDGTQIAFSAGDEKNREVFVIDADGSNLHRLTDDPANDVTPEWNPVGESDGGSGDEPRCLTEEEAAGDPSLRTPDPLRGDVDGDGLHDEVSVAVDPQAEEPTCKYFLVVETGAGARAARIDMTHVERIDEEVFGLQSVAEVNGQPGLEIFVRVHSGVATEFGQIYTMSGDTLTLVVAKGPDGENGLFAYAGSLSGISAVDCAGLADVPVVSVAFPGENAQTWTVERTFYEPINDSVLESTGSERHELAAEEIESGGLGRFSEFREAPLDDCPGFVSAS